MRALLIMCLLFGLAAPLAGFTQEQAASAEVDEPAAPVEFLSLAAVLIGDGNYQRARNVLARIDAGDEDLDLARYHTLSGLVALNLDELPLAASHFEDAIAAGQEQDVVWLYLAQAYFGQQLYENTLEALDSAGADATRVPSVFMMRAQAHWELQNYQEAWQVLGEGRRIFPDRAGGFARRQVFLLVDQGLYQEAADQGLQFLESGLSSNEDAVAIGNALRETGQYRQAAVILEKARLSAPGNVMLGKVLSHVYLDQGDLLAAADVMRTTALYDPELASDAAELYKRAGWLIQALSLNARVIDQAKKLKQRLSIFLELERFEQAAGMERDLSRVGLLSDEDIRYALAYALFKSGEFERAEAHLQQLSRSDLFRRATELRRAMEQCAESPWMCG
ncbi:MAG: tetratricopeptide repeat protein [Wenzhouxiangellaceae bacterium]|nr:tetratricopeptide repeat protein [Wenzhouxiangellaceae bacterium]MBS3747517.1 tetratricopeptide repeat protein [Wenzhouxiangellaceae bacterium]MBS3824485.1 tetratricopeptide repeat protein [Wenzhouxiangellaceae bacterium]